MALNRMFLVNVATGQRVLLAKHPVAGDVAGAWLFQEKLLGDLLDAFDAELRQHGAPHGSTAWRVEYEHDEVELDAALKEKCSARGGGR